MTDAPLFALLTLYASSLSVLAGAIGLDADSWRMAGLAMLCAAVCAVELWDVPVPGVRRAG